MAKNIELSESLEDYLEAILLLQEANKVARAKEIADKMGVSLASVTASLKKLRQKELVNYAPYQYITLTGKGQRLAKVVLQKHNIIKDFLTRILCLEASNADLTACRMEHAMDKEAIKKLREFMTFIDICPRAGQSWLQNIHNCGSLQESLGDCDNCLTDCQQKYLGAVKKQHGY